MPVWKSEGMEENESRMKRIISRRKRAAHSPTTHSRISFDMLSEIRGCVCCVYGCVYVPGCRPEPLSPDAPIGKARRIDAPYGMLAI